MTKKSSKKKKSKGDKKKEPSVEIVEEEQQGKVKKQYIVKFYSKTYNTLYEAVLINGGQAKFVCQDWDVKAKEPFAKLIDMIPIPELAKHPTMELYPPQREQYLSMPYEFASEDELNKYLRIAAEEMLDSLFRRQRLLGTNYIDANDTHLTMLGAVPPFTYFQDRMGQTHYDEFIGDTDTGKTANLMFLHYTCYRAMLDVAVTPANIYGFLGNFEEGQGVLLEDEADDIENNPDKMKIYKSGYNSGKKVTRHDITPFGRNIHGWNTFCYKAFSAEQAPSSNKAKGLMDRTFTYYCTSGNPPYDIQEVINPAGDEELTERLNELIHNRKVLFAFRLLHHGDSFPNIRLSVKNREKQLCKPLLRLFQNSDCQEQIGAALAEKIGEKRGLKRDTLEAKMLEVITGLMKENEQAALDREKSKEWIFEPWTRNEIPTFTLFERVCSYLDGTYRHPGDKSFDTDQFGLISHDRIRRICGNKFGGQAKRRNSIRYLDFNPNRLEKAKAAYVFPDKVVILDKKNVRESGEARVPKFDLFSVSTSENEKGGNGQNKREFHEGNEHKGDNDKKEVDTKNDQNSGSLASQESNTFKAVYNIEEGNGKGKRSNNNNLLKCPHCNFKNVHQESIDHHIRYKHNNAEASKNIPKEL